MSGRREVNPVREGLLLAGGTCALVLLGALVPHLFLLAPVPLGVLTYRYGLRAGMLAATVTAALQLLVGHPLAAVIAFLILGVGLTLGGALREGYPGARVFVGGLLVTLLLIGLISAFAHFALRVSLAEVMTAPWQRWMEEALEVWERSGMSPEQIAERRQAITENLAHLRALYPGYAVISAMLLSGVDLWLIRFVLRRMGEELAPFTPFARWRFPWPLALGYIVGRGLGLVSHWVEAPTVAAIGANLELIFTYVFVVQGLAVAWYFFDQRGIGKIRYLLALLLLQFHWVPLLAGLFEVWFDFRGIQRRSERGGG
ncbi:MAG TPA: DUF2232 domain-containing protein [Limnochordia bacterium]